MSRKNPIYYLLSNHLEVGHHHHVLVLQVVAVEDVLPPVAVEPRDDPRFLPRREVHGKCSY